MYIDCNSRVRWAALNEIDAGVCENLTYKEMGAQFPELAAQRKRDKLNFRYTAKEKIPYYSIPLHTLVKIICKEESYDEERYPLMPVNVMESLPRFLKTIEESKKQEKKC